MGINWWLVGLYMVMSTIGITLEDKSNPIWELVGHTLTVFSGVALAAAVFWDVLEMDHWGS